MYYVILFVGVYHAQQHLLEGVDWKAKAEVGEHIQETQVLLDSEMRSQKDLIIW